MDESSPPENDGQREAVESNDAAPNRSNINNNAAVGKNSSIKGGKRVRGKKEDQVPIEELYDLSKPIKRVSLMVSI